MAKPQLENGYTKIANELLEAFAHFRIPGRLRQVLDVIIRQTYGWKKKEAQISLQNFQARTGLSKSHICHAISNLQKMQIIAKNGNTLKNNTIAKNGNTEAVTYGIQKDFKKWLPIAKNGNVAKNGNKPLPKMATLYNKVLKKKEKRNIYTGKQGFDYALNQEAFTNALEKAYGHALNINQCVREMELWLTNHDWQNPKTKKLYVDFKRFISGWLKRELKKLPPVTSDNSNNEIIDPGTGSPAAILKITSTRLSAYEKLQKGLV